MKFNMFATDVMASVVGLNTLSENIKRQSYTPYGDYTNVNMFALGYNGERRDPVTGVNHLGNGYRGFNPQLQRFNAPDSWSPFGDGGLNSYTYCEGDPINNSDQTGHMSTQASAGLGIALSILGIGLAMVGGVSAIGAVTGAKAVAKASTVMVMSALPGIAGVATGVAATQVDDPEMAKALGGVSLSLGGISLITGGISMYKGNKKQAAANQNRTQEMLMTRLHDNYQAEQSVRAGRESTGNTNRLPRTVRPADSTVNINTDYINERRNGVIFEDGDAVSVRSRSESSNNTSGYAENIALRPTTTVAPQSPLPTYNEASSGLPSYSEAMATKYFTSSAFIKL